MRNIKLVIEYDGSDFHGWQRQAISPTVQAVLEHAISKMTGEKISLTGSGRTDAGVHALGQVANFHTSSDIPTVAFLKGLNSILPSSVAVKDVCEVPLDFHARYSAVAKEYIYHIQISCVRSPLWCRTAWLMPWDLDIGAMRDASRLLLGKHDFKCFQAAGSEVKTTVRQIVKCGIDLLPPSCFYPEDVKNLLFYIVADGFLKYMVRNIVGTLVEIGTGRYPASWISELLFSKDRKLAGKTAPARGLFLKRVYYRDPF